VVVAINVFGSDTLKELEVVQTLARQNGAFDAVLCRHWALGSKVTTLSKLSLQNGFFNRAQGVTSISSHSFEARKLNIGRNNSYIKGTSF